MDRPTSCGCPDCDCGNGGVASLRGVLSDMQSLRGFLSQPIYVSGGGGISAYYDTTANWDIQSSLIAEQGAIYVYSDYYTTYDEVGNPTFSPGVKIGDGTSYLIDIPVLSDTGIQMVLDYLTTNNYLVTSEDRLFWNNKVSAALDEQDPEILIFSTD